MYCHEPKHCIKAYNDMTTMNDKEDKSILVK